MGRFHEKRLVPAVADCDILRPGTVSASAVTNDTVKVGLRYGSSVMSSANLENDEGSGYEFGYFEDDRTFVSLGETDETAITMEPGRPGRHPR